jgi:hypothetical protein
MCVCLELSYFVGSEGAEVFGEGAGGVRLGAGANIPRRVNVPGIMRKEQLVSVIKTK